MKVLILSVLTVISLIANAQDFTHIPRSGECYPKSPYSKKYIKVKKFGPYMAKTFSCSYICLSAREEKIELSGTLKVSVYFGERGNEFVCKGYEKDMKWIETPLSNTSWGRFEIGKTRPFFAQDSGINELESWNLSNF